MRNEVPRQRGPRVVRKPKARLRIRRRVVPGAAIARTGRRLAVLVLITALVWGGYRFFIAGTPGAGALQFTEHVLGTAGTATDVLGTHIADLDGDGDQDIVTAGAEGVKVYEQTSSGSFSKRDVDGASGERIQAKDIDGDGDLDLLVGFNEDPPVKWYRNDGDFSFAGTSLASGGSDGVAYAGDINADGHVDIVTSTNESGDRVLRRWMNSGSASFTSSTLESTSGVTAVAIGDVDGDGYQDIVTGGSDGLQRWDTSNGTSWSATDIDDSNNNGNHVVTRDVNEDGKLDIVAAEGGANKAVLYRNTDGSSLERIALTGSPDASSVDPIDFDGDGDIDIVTAAQDDDTVYWYENDGSESFTQHTVATDLSQVFSVAAGDIDGDGDVDVATQDFTNSTAYWYERAQAAPSATTPGEISQDTDGSGHVVFKTTISDEDSEETRVRVQYSLDDGSSWSKAYVDSASVGTGTVDVNNDNGYQIGTSDGIDTDDAGEVELTITWDSRSENNLGAIPVDSDTVKVRIIPNDGASDGTIKESASFVVDNAAPTGFGSLRGESFGSTSVGMSWSRAQDSSQFSFELHYGVDEDAVEAQNASVWDGDDDSTMDDIEATGTTVTDLQSGARYAFMLVARDAHGNEASSDVFRAQTGPGGDSGESASSPAPGSDEQTATPDPAPSTTEGNAAPTANAGENQIVAPEALVILDGSGSGDPDGDTLTYKWRQLDGPQVELRSARTSIASFSAGDAGATYIFALDVRDSSGASSMDTVTVAVKRRADGADDEASDSDKGQDRTAQTDAGDTGGLAFLRAGSPGGGSGEATVLLRTVQGIDLTVFLAALLVSGMSIGERFLQSTRTGGQRGRIFIGTGQNRDSPRGRIVHYKTGRPIADARVMIYGSDGKLRDSHRVNDSGEFPTLLPAGAYTLGVQAPGYEFASSESSNVRLPSGIVYTGGTLRIEDDEKPVNVLVPLKPQEGEMDTLRSRLLTAWQTGQRYARASSWPVLVAGSLLNTGLVFFAASIFFLIIEVLYVGLVIAKVYMEVRQRPAYGMVRDAITHTPIRLAVVRLYERDSNRLVMTRVTNAEGKFFALPPPGKYTVSISKPGYARFTREGVEVTADEDTALQLTADLMPVAPQRAGGTPQPSAA